MQRNKIAAGIAAGLCLWLSPALSGAQAGPDTLRLTLPQTEQTFLEKNLQLLARHYNVQADSALIAQARRWDNPTLSVDQNIYSNHRFFEHGRDEAGQPLGQLYIQVQQLIQTAGKRNKQVKMAVTNAHISRLQLLDLLRTLKLQLRSDFFTIIQLQGNAELYSQEAQQLEKLLAGMSAQFSAGNIARKDLLRVQAIQVNLQQEMAANARTLEDTETELRTLLQLTGDSFVLPVGPAAWTPPALPPQPLGGLVDLARESNTTYQLAQAQVQYQQQNLAYQKALAAPDITLGPNYDRASNYTPNYVGLTVGLPLPIFNRNKGNIRSADYGVREAGATLQESGLELENKVTGSYRKLQLLLRMGAARQQEFYSSYSQLNNNIIESYNKRQLSLLEFIDYFNAWEDIREKQLQQELSIRLAAEDLNYQVGADVIHQ